MSRYEENLVFWASLFSLIVGVECIPGGGGAIAGIVIGVIFFIVCHIYLFYLLLKIVNWCKARKKRYQFTEDVNTKIEAGSASYPIPELKNIEIKKKLSEGNYGEIYLGIWNDTKVALKKLKGNNQFNSFKKEAGILFTIVHPNCVQFLGIYIDETKNEEDDVDKGPDRYIVLEYMSRGNSLDLLRSSNDLKVSDLLQMALSASKGMTYLEDKKVVHSDLACRNLLVSVQDGKYQLKVSDFGLSFEQNSVSGNVKVPVRWTAPELLNKMRLEFQPTSQSDVWSFGVVLWEIFSLGAAPYKGMKNKDVISFVEKGGILDKPTDFCPDDLYELMKSCWKTNPTERPSFSILTKHLNNIYKNFKAAELNKDLQRQPFDFETDNERVYESQEELYQTLSSGGESPKVSPKQEDDLYQTMSSTNSTDKEAKKEVKDETYQNKDQQQEGLYQTVHGDKAYKIETESEPMESHYTEGMYNDVDDTKSFKIEEGKVSSVKDKKKKKSKKSKKSKSNYGVVDSEGITITTEPERRVVANP